MKKISLLITSLMLSCSFSFAQLPLYLNFGSHNETTDTFDYINSSADYQLIKGIAKQIADSIIAHNARWNMQVESNFIRGCIVNENAATNPNDFLQWADASPDIEVDVHNHFQPPFINPYNASDLNHLLDSCGLIGNRKNLGGFIWKNFTNPPVSEDWTQYQTAPVVGFKYPFTSWRPQVIWGGGSPNHISDYNAYGIWKPSGPTDSLFPIHNPNNYLTCIGNGCAEDFVIFDTTNVQNVIDNLVAMINYLQAQPTDPNAFYTATIMMNFKNFNTPGFVQKVCAVLNAMDTYSANGKIIWATLTEKYDLYHSFHTNVNDYFERRCEDVNVGVTPSPLSVSSLQFFPNPAGDLITVKNSSNENSSWRIFSLEGKEIMNGKFNNALSINIHSLESGIYFLEVNTANGKSVNKFFKGD
ncbi:MAG: T9SS type A sorting domain-containing protein [Bacteroidota bacterium]